MPDTGIDTTGVKWVSRPIELLEYKVETCNTDGYTIRNRIGSESANGKVYDIQMKYSPTRLALKIFRDSGEECKYAKLLSERHPGKFPDVSGCKICPEVVLDEESTFYIDNMALYMKEYMVETLSGSKLQKKRLKISLDGTTERGDDLLEKAKTLGVSDETISYLRTRKCLPMDVMTSELLWGDLDTFIKENLYQDQLPRILSQVFGIMKILVNDNIVHDDLHLGNVLLRKEKIGKDVVFTPVVHDFGTTSDVIDQSDSIRDVSRFLYAFSMSPLGETYGRLLNVSKDVVKTIEDKGDNVTKDEILDVLSKLETTFMNRMEHGTFY